MGSRGNSDTRRRKRKERKKRKAAQRRSLRRLEERTAELNEWLGCPQCGKAYFASKRTETRCAECRKKLKSFGARKRAALEKYRERKAAEEALDRELLVKIGRVYDPD